MRAVIQSKYGPPSEVLRMGEVPPPAIKKDDEVLIRVRAASVHADVWHSVTGYPFSWRMMSGLRAPKHPVPGNDLAGIVESAGPRVTRFKPGDEVFGQTYRGFAYGNGGAFAELAVAPEDSIALKPRNVTFEQAASVPASGYIACSQLSRFPNRMDGQHTLVNGTGGGVGSIALQVLKSRGAYVTAVDAGPKLEMLRSMGADETVDYTRTNFLDRGVQYDLIFDVVSNLTPKQYKSALKPAGLYLWIGHEHYGRAKGSVLFGSGIPHAFRLMVKGLLGDPNLPKMDFPPVIPKVKDMLALMRDLMEQGKLSPAVERAYPLESAAEAFDCLEAGKVLGKLVIVP